MYIFADVDLATGEEYWRNNIYIYICIYRERTYTCIYIYMIYIYIYIYTSVGPIQ